MRQFIRLVHTLRHLRLRQIVYQAVYRLTGRLQASFGARAQVRTKVREQSTGAVTFNFLNRSVTFDSPGNIDWNYGEYGKLWTYNLNYFEYLRDMDPEVGRQLIESWINGESGHRDGWEPYPLSLRLVSWIAFYQEADGPVPPEVMASIARQYAALRSKIEYHLDGNHLLENALALTLTAHYLGDNPYAARAGKLLREQLRQQYLADGAHYELSAMYHLILLDRGLTVHRSLSRSAAPASAQKLIGFLAAALRAQLSWALAFCTPDGRYAHFNDSTEGIAPALSELVARADQQEIPGKPGELSVSGYRRYSTRNLDVWIDAAAIGPDHIPGHAHADNLTFCLHLDGQPVIVDTAVSTYEKNERRHLERSTASHNTVTINEKNSSDVWAGFRVGRRARTTILSEGERTITARHDGYGITHERQFFLTNEQLIISDTLRPPAPGTAHFHFHHDRPIILESDGCTVGDLRITWDHGAATLGDYEQAIGWNETRPAKKLKVLFEGQTTFYLTPAK